MEVVSACPLRVASVRWQPRPGAFLLTVVCKATYVLLPGESPLAREQDGPSEADGHWNDDETRSLHVANDLVPFKGRAEVLLLGHAFAPERRPARSLLARLIVGCVDKSIAVFEDRACTAEGVVREGPAFTKMPLRWERAAGGPGTSNPVGVRTGRDAAPDERYGLIAIPNLQVPGTHPTGPGEPLAPIGFGPIAPRWPTRMEKLHPSLAGWDFTRWSEWPLPEGVDAAFWSAAPLDQQLPELHGDERITLENLHPDHARLSTTLARALPCAAVERGAASGAGEEIPLFCDTLVIDTDRGRCSLTWRGQVPLRHPHEAGRVVITIGTASAQGVPPSGRSAGAADVKATVLGALPRGPGLPFMKASGQGRAEAPPVVVDMK